MLPRPAIPISANPPAANAAGALGGQQPGKLGLGQSSFEVYRFFDGRWWKERFAVEPGERVGDRKSIRTADNTNVDIDFSTDWYVMDIVADIQSSDNTDRGGAAAVESGELQGRGGAGENFLRREAAGRSGRQREGA